MFGDCLQNVRGHAPLVHCITNYVTVNDVANVLLACGASPIMADDTREVEEITTICNGLYMNIGTLNERTIPAMLAAGKKANELGHPVILDPVGAGASSLRTQTALQLLDQVHVTVIRGNISEIKTLAAGFGSTRGVDADAADAITKDNLAASVMLAKAAANRFGSIVAITGATDLVTDGSTCYAITNGRAEMGRITGTGCQLSALTAAFVAANMQAPLAATAAAVATMGLAGQIAWAAMLPGDGNATYRSRIIDAIYNLGAQALEGGADYGIR